MPFKLHCNRKLDKSVRDDILLKSTCPSQISAALPEISAYCAKDVEATVQLFTVLFPKFWKKSRIRLHLRRCLRWQFRAAGAESGVQRYIENVTGCREATEKNWSFEELNKLVEETITEGLQGKWIKLNEMIVIINCYIFINTYSRCRSC